MTKKAVVIGSGIAGLASSLRLRAKGYDTHVFEANSYVGGKMTVVEKDGFRWDAGPSLFTMPHLVEELFELFGKRPGDHFQYIKKDNICNYYWEDGISFIAKADREEFIKEASDTFGISQLDMTSYLDDSKTKYDLTAHLFLEKSLHKLTTWTSGEAVKSWIKSSKLDLFKNLNQVNEQKLKEPHLVQLFNRFATYNGSSPYRTPGIMSMIPHLEMYFGTFLPKGGMHAITQSLYDLAISEGIHFHLNSPVKEILHNRKKVLGIRTQETIHHSDLVVTNMDVYNAYSKILHNTKKPKKTLKQEVSCSALIFYWGVDKTFPELDLHNILFSDHYEEEFNHIFQKKSISEDPTVYINITSKHEKDDAPEGMENWFILINAPGNFGQDWDSIIDETRENIINKINRMLKTDIRKHIITEELLDPRSIEAKTSSFRGALYGSASNNKFSSFLRHPNFSGNIKNLYFCGGSVHPGGGIPLCLSSAKIVSDLIPEL